MSIFNKKKILVTHDGSFHSDDLFATAVLSIVYGGKITVIRTRDLELMSTADVVYDVGGVYDPEANRFDHHQKEGAGQRENGIPYASFGLVWKKYGEQICENKKVADMIDKRIVQYIDAVDCGVDVFKTLYDGIILSGVDQAFLNKTPTWKEGDKNINKIFMRQLKEVEKFLLREILITKHDEEGSVILLTAYDRSEDKRIIKIDINLPRYLFRNTLSRLPEPLYIIYPNTDKKNWKIETIKKSPDTMESRKSLPESWRGEEDLEKLKEVSGVDDIIFCHRSGFLAETISKESAIALAEKALIA